MKGPVRLALVHYGKETYASDSVDGHKCLEKTCKNSHGYSHTWWAGLKLSELGEVSEKPLWAKVTFRSNGRFKEWKRLKPPALASKILEASGSKQKKLIDQVPSRRAFNSIPTVVSIAVKQGENRAFALWTLVALHDQLDEELEPHLTGHDNWDVLRRRSGITAEALFSGTRSEAEAAAAFMTKTGINRPLRDRMARALSPDNLEALATFASDDSDWRRDAMANLVRTHNLRDP